LAKLLIPDVLHLGVELPSTLQPVGQGYRTTLGELFSLEANRLVELPDRFLQLIPGHLLPGRELPFLKEEPEILDPNVLLSQEALEGQILHAELHLLIELTDGLSVRELELASSLVAIERVLLNLEKGQPLLHGAIFGVRLVILVSQALPKIYLFARQPLSQGTVFRVCEGIAVVSVVAATSSPVIFTWNCATTVRCLVSAATRAAATATRGQSRDYLLSFTRERVHPPNGAIGTVAERPAVIRRIAHAAHRRGLVGAEVNYVQGAIGPHSQLSPRVGRRPGLYDIPCRMSAPIGHDQVFPVLS
jgi:hypothetical protein